MNVQIWGLTDPGNIRQQNQDTYEIVSFGHDRALMIVCDGMGGAKSGNIASSMAAETFVAEVRRCQKLATGTERVISILKGALELANQAVYEHSGLSDDYSGMGTTLVAAFLLRNTAVVINVGDSRAYHFSQQGVRQLSCDHSVVELMVQRGELTREQAKNYPGKNLITRAVGTEAQVNADLFSLQLERNDCLLLCSDGLSNQMADQEILFEVVHGAHKNDCCQRLLQIAKDRGAPDNVTSVLIAL